MSPRQVTVLKQEKDLPINIRQRQDIHIIEGKASGEQIEEPRSIPAFSLYSHEYGSQSSSFGYYGLIREQFLDPLHVSFIGEYHEVYHSLIKREVISLLHLDVSIEGIDLIQHGFCFTYNVLNEMGF